MNELIPTALFSHRHGTERIAEHIAAQVNLTKSLIKQVIARFKSPVIYFSGGKDSMVMLHILSRDMVLDFPTIFHREPFNHEKYEFGMRILRDWNIKAYDYPPTHVSLWLGKDILAFTNHYQIGRMKDGKVSTLDLPKNLLPPNLDTPLICGLDDIIRRPTGFFNYPWDLAFIGHKDCDSDQIAGKTHLYADVVQHEEGPSLFFPLRHWSDADIWNYIHLHGVPMQLDRYDVMNRKERDDKKLNSDYFTACMACVDSRNDKFVCCPKMGGAMVNNISAQIDYRETSLQYTGEKPNG